MRMAIRVISKLRGLVRLRCCMMSPFAIRVHAYVTSTEPSISKNIQTSDGIYRNRKLVLPTSLQDGFKQNTHLWSWILAHLKYPFASPSELLALSQLSGLPVMYVDNWMKGTRAKYLEPSTKQERDLDNPTSFCVTPTTLTLLEVSDVDALRALFTPWAELENRIQTIINDPNALESAQKQSDDLLRSILQMEHRTLLYTGQLVPKKLIEDDLTELAKESTLDLRIYTYKFLRLKYNYRHTKLEKKEQRANEQTTVQEEYTDPNNRCIRRVAPTTVIDHYRHNLYYAERFGPHFIVDLSFGEHMRKVDIKSTVKQLEMAFAYVRQSRQPFHMHCVNLDACPKTRQMWIDAFKTRGIFSHVGVTIDSADVTELYPEDSLVYLTPDAPTFLEEYDPNSVYIMAALVDKVPQPRRTFGKARQHNIRMAKLPLHLGRFVGRPLLALNHVMAIMSDVKDGVSWVEAFKHIGDSKFRR